jgi:regulator of sirC expression with transglutaminase-like and TPR domain
LGRPHPPRDGAFLAALPEKPVAALDSRAKFRLLVMVTVLQRDLRVWYDLSCTRDPIDRRDARPWFLCGPLTGRGGTGASLPVLYLTLGRRLGYPLHLVRANEHLFVRWEEPGERFNIECTSPGFEPRTDQHYLRFPTPPSEAELATGLLFRNLSPRETAGEFLAQRGHVLLDHLRVDEALGAYRQAWALDPGNICHQSFCAIAESLLRLLDAERRGIEVTFRPKPAESSG